MVSDVRTASLRAEVFSKARQGLANNKNPIDTQKNIWFISMCDAPFLELAVIGNRVFYYVQSSRHLNTEGNNNKYYKL
jgi:hypothetical protein